MKSISYMVEDQVFELLTFICLNSLLLLARLHSHRYCLMFALKYAHPHCLHYSVVIDLFASFSHLHLVYCSPPHSSYINNSMELVLSNSLMAFGFDSTLISHYSGSCLSWAIWLLMTIEIVDVCSCCDFADSLLHAVERWLSNYDEVQCSAHSSISFIVIVAATRWVLLF